MSAEYYLPIAERLARLLQYLGIERAHVAGGRLEAGALVAAVPDVVASVTLVCPSLFDGDSLRPLASRLLLFHGDRGPQAPVVPRVLPDLPGASAVLLRDYADALWSDPIAERLSEISPTLLAFLANVSQSYPVDPIAPAADEGEVEGITYRVQGEGPPLILLPIGLAASQWEPLLPVLSQHYCTISLGGAFAWPVVMLEQRARSGYGAVVNTLFDQIALRPGESVLDVGCGSGVVSRRLALRTGGSNPIVGVDVNRFLLREAGELARAEGVNEMIHFQHGNAESLPFPPNSFDVTVACTVIEEGDADRMLAEMVRVTKPGGRVGVIVRATDMPGWDNLPLPPELRAKAGTGASAGAAEGGCADASLYQRVRAAGLGDLKIGPQLGTYYADPRLDWVQRSFETSQVAALSAEEARLWKSVAAQAEVEGNYLWAYPSHCAVGTKR